MAQQDSAHKMLSWPNGKRIAVALTVMFETWSEGKAPSYSVQATSLRPGQEDFAGKAWSTYGGRVGVWRILRNLDRWGIPATFFTNAAAAELYPDATKAIVKSGHELGGHAIYQDQLMGYKTPEEQRTTIKTALDTLEEIGGQRPTGWLSPVLAFTPETVDLLAAAGLEWHADVTYVDLPHRRQTPHGPIACVPNSDFTDNRTLKTSTRDLVDVYTDTFDYQYEHEPMSLLAMTLHCQYGGRPMVIGAFERVVKHIAAQDGVWFARHSELGRWALDNEREETTYAERYF
ncbi:MAG: polysaccharide deacetylase family protein [Ilumatobacteraceae bacterium]